MSSLYRQYRPSRFAEIIGQDHVRSSLLQALANNQVHHAYLLAGPRGTGKTTIARLLAKAVNCTKRAKDGEPCDKCEQCQAFVANRSLDVIEIDAASNRGIEEIRALREQIAFRPASAVRKIYIIDEVHMLTKEAFNALLKTLEEPPEHVMFVLATTELAKVPDTIMSRCVRYHFQLASPDSLVGLLKKVAAEEKMTIDDEALAIVATRAEGSYRDALSLLGSVGAQKEAVTAEAMRTILGLPPTAWVVELEQAVRQGQVKQVAATLATARSQGLDATVLTKSLIDRLRDEILIGSDAASAATVSLLEELLAAAARSRVSPDPTAFLTSVLLRLCLQTAPVAVPVSPPPAVDTIEKVESTPEPVAVDAVNAAPVVEQIPSEPALGGDFWANFLSAIKVHNHALYAVVRSAELADLTEQKIVIAVHFRFYVDRLMESKNRRLIEDTAGKIVSRSLLLECIVRPKKPTAEPDDKALLNTVVDVFELEEVA
jgi:DNA polymerase-3 subunit gamma/tau